MFGCKFIDSCWPPWCSDLSAVNKQPCIEAIIPYLQESIIISAKEGRAGIRFGGNISRQSNAQGRASIFLISSSLGLKRPSSASMIGLAI